MTAGRAGPYGDQDGYPPPLAMPEAGRARGPSRLPVFLAGAATAASVVLAAVLVIDVTGNHSPGAMPALSGLATQAASTSALPAAQGTPGSPTATPATVTPSPTASHSPSPTARPTTAKPAAAIVVSPTRLTVGLRGQWLTLTNPGQVSMSWALALPADLAVAMNGPVSGTLQPGASTRVYIVYNGHGRRRPRMHSETITASPGKVAITVTVV